MKKKILLTGATGYIGSNLLKKLLKDTNFNIIALYNNSLPENIDNGVTWIKYTGEYSSLKDIDENIDIIIHLATYFTTAHSPENVSKIINANVLFGTHLLEFARQNNINKFINTSTFAQSIDNSTYNPQNFYTSTKQAFESILMYYTESGLINNITISLSDTYGPGDNRPKFINLLIEALGKDVVFNMSPGNQEVRYVHVNDVVDSYIVAIELLMENKINKSKTFSVSGIEPLTLNELVNLVSKVAGKKIETNPGFYPYREMEIMKCFPKFEILPDWKPSIKLSDGIKQIIQINESNKH